MTFSNPASMDRRRLLGGAGALAVAGCATLPRPGDDQVLLLSYFIGADEGRDGLRLAMSEDGYTFTPLRGGAGLLMPVVGTSKLMRDPCILHGPDGLYHMVWTADWFGPVIGYATSPDLVNWSEQRTLPVMRDFPGVRNTWAPEIYYDAREGHYVIVWSSSVAGRFGATDETGFDGLNHRPYVTTTRDFETFTPTRLLYDPGFNAIDFTFITLGDGSLRIIIKDETHDVELRRYLRVATAQSYLGPFGEPSAPFTPSWTEGATATRLGDRYIVYFDAYEDHHFGAVETTDFVTFTDVTSRIAFPHDARHGTVLWVPRKLAASI